MQPGQRIRCRKCGEVFAAPSTAAVPVREPAPAPSRPAPEDAAAADATVSNTTASALEPIPEESDDAPAPTGDERTAKDRTGQPRAKAKPGGVIKGRPVSRRPRDKGRERDPRPRKKPQGVSPLLILGGLAVGGFVLLATVAGVVLYSWHESAQKAEEVAQAEARERAERAQRDANPPPFVPAPPIPSTPPERPTLPANPWAQPLNPPPRQPFVPPVLPSRPPVEPATPKPPEKAKLTFPPAAPVPLKPAPLAEAKTELKLPGTVTDACVGGGGRFWCLMIGDSKQVAVFDVNRAKVTKFLPVAGGKMVMAAGMNKLVVGYPDTGALTRFDLTTLEKEVTVQSPVEKFDALLLGAASAGPLFLGRTPVDLQTFKLMDAPAPPAGFGLYGRRHSRISPDGHVIGSWSTEFSPSGLNVATFGDTSVKPFSEHTSVGFVLPAADGTTVTAAGVYGPTGKKLAGPDGYFFRTPAQEGGFYLTIPGGGGAQVNTGMGDVAGPTTVYATGDARALVKLSDVELPAGNEAWAGTDFLADKKVLFTTTGQLIAVLAPSGDKLVLHKFDLEATLDKAGVDYLFVTSRAPGAVPGRVFRYAPEVRSKKGGVKVKVDAGPGGMAVDASGVVTWPVPSDFSGSESVILTVTDRSGQEIFHTFTLAPAAATPGPAAATPAPAPVIGGPAQVTLAPNLSPLPAPPAGARPGLVRPAAKPAPITPTKAADKAELKLPGTADATCFGGGGRFVLLRIPKEKKVAVLDVCEGKIVKYVPIPEDGALIAAGNEHLFVLAPTANVIQRWSLTTFEKEATVANPLSGTPRQLLMGHATDGPLFVVGPNRMLDPKTFKALDLPAEANGRGMGAMSGHPQHPPAVRVSADGRVFAWWTQGLSPSGLSSMVLGESSAKAHYEHTTVGAILPGPDGTLFTAGGLYTPELKPIGETGRYQYWHHVPVPAAHGRMYLSVAAEDFPGQGRAASKVALKMVGDDKALANLSGLDGLDVPRNNNQTMARGLQMADRVFLVPDAKALAVLHASADKVTVHAFDVEAMLAKAGVDYLFVASRPPGATRGATFSYKPEVKSRKGGVKIKLDAGPEGMKVATDGTVTWDVPKNFNEASVSVILTVSDKSGQEAFHSFTLPVAPRP
ncbi:hypothetical protein C1280_16985 [Gemmata obscuriglobus]|uniref:Uncharacterized protein n=1 Tax=Gemmata obscuriglobus TaxID=114 RepID=A0A2Z3GYI8_9BACT|nr:hypothetical protein C1280_16985 [Gemmata obscuriglobus]